MKVFPAVFRSGDWILQKDHIAASKSPIISIRHLCKSQEGSGHTIWFSSKHTITQCHCGIRVPDEIQGLFVLFNMEWLQKTERYG